MSKKGAVPDAWDDDWVNAAESADSKVEPDPAKLSKAEKRAQHTALQKQLWDTAENPNRMHWLETQGVVPLKQEFKPQVTLLSRKPAPTIAKRNGADGAANADDDEDSEEEARKKRETEFEERQRKAKIEREEKQRKYAEARERIMGSSNTASPSPASRESSQGRDNRRARGGKQSGSSRSSRPDSPAEQSAAAGENKPLFDPMEMARRMPKREVNTPTLDAPSRQPRGPESGRGGFGFAARGGKALE